MKKKDKKPYIIAEIGINHDGSFKKAKKLIFLAKTSGADAVKFQLFEPEDLYLPGTKNFKGLNKFKLTKPQLNKLCRLAKKLKIKFICTAFSLNGATFLKSIKVDAIKIASMDANNYLLIDHCLKLNLPLIISTGMCNLKELNKLEKIFKNKKNIAILHCMSNYPSEIRDINLKFIKKFKKIFNKKILIGYSDHTIGPDACLSAITEGAQVIEKHFTDKKKKYLDHFHSADEIDMKTLCSFAKNYHKSLGKLNSLNKRKDLPNAKFYRRGVFSRTKIIKNTLLNLKNIYISRPQLNNSITLDKSIFRKKLKINIIKNKQIKNKDIIN